MAVRSAAWVVRMNHPCAHAVMQGHMCALRLQGWCTLHAAHVETSAAPTHAQVARPKEGHFSLYELVAWCRCNVGNALCVKADTRTERFGMEVHYTGEGKHTAKAQQCAHAPCTAPITPRGTFPRGILFFATRVSWAELRTGLPLRIYLDVYLYQGSVACRCWLTSIKRRHHRPIGSFAPAQVKAPNL